MTAIGVPWIRRVKQSDTSAWALRVRRALARGVCVTCGATKPLNRRRRQECSRCENKRYAARKAVKSERKLCFFPTGYQGRIRCLKCEASFLSPDRRAVRHCDRCRDRLAYIADGLGDGGEWAV